MSRNGNALGKYYVKVHIGLAVYPYNQNADLREVFAYKLLELIKLGPKVHFVPNVHYSALGLYIATEEGNFHKCSHDFIRCVSDMQRKIIYFLEIIEILKFVKILGLSVYNCHISHTIIFCVFSRRISPSG